MPPAGASLQTLSGIARHGLKESLQQALDHPLRSVGLVERFTGAPPAGAVGAAGLAQNVKHVQTLYQRSVIRDRLPLGPHQIQPLLRPQASIGDRKLQRRELAKRVGPCRPVAPRDFEPFHPAKALGLDHPEDRRLAKNISSAVACLTCLRASGSSILST